MILCLLSHFPSDDSRVFSQDDLEVRILIIYHNIVEEYTEGTLWHKLKLGYLFSIGF